MSQDLAVVYPRNNWGGSTPSALNARLSVIEEKADQTGDDIKDLKKQVTSLEESVRRLITETERYKGFVGGVSLAITVLWAGIALFKDTIVGWFTK